MNRRNKISYKAEIKKSFTLRFINGESCTRLAKELRPDQPIKISRARIYQWVKAYNQGGMKALENNYKNNFYWLNNTIKTNKDKTNKKIDYSTWTKEELIISNEIKDEFIKNNPDISKKKKFESISKIRNLLPLNKLCILFGVSTSGYKYWFKHQNPENQYIQELLLLIKEVYFKNKGVKGIVRIKQELEKDHGTPVNVKTVHRYLKHLGLKSVIRQRSKAREAKTTNRPFNDLIKKNFKSETPNQKWFTDTTYVATKNGFGYLNIVLDSFNNSIVSWMFTKQNDEHLNINNVKHALLITNSKPIINTDHHAHYYSKKYFDLEKQFDFKISKGPVGDSLANRPAEYFFSIIKSECLYLEKSHNKDFIEVEKIISDFIYDYSNKRTQSCLNWQTPNQFITSYNTSIGQY